MKSGKIGHVVSITGHEVDRNYNNCCNLEDVVVLTRKEFQQMQRDLEVSKILKKSYIELEVKAFDRDFLYLTFETRITREEAQKIKQWMEEQE